MIDEHEPRRPDRACSACRRSRFAIDWAKVVTHMITIKGIYGREMFETWYAMTAMLQTSAACDRSPR